MPLDKRKENGAVHQEGAEADQIGHLLNNRLEVEDKIVITREHINHKK